MMRRKLWEILSVSLLIVAFVTASSFGMDPSLTKKTSHGILAKDVPKYKLAGAEKGIGVYTPPSKGEQSLGFDEFVSQSPGLQVGLTTYDYQANGRMNRQVDWRGTQMIHFTWMKQLDKILGGDRGTGYEAWDADLGWFAFAGEGGGCDVHPRLTEKVNYSGYVGLDVDTEGKVNVCNHHKETPIYASTVWYDFAPINCNFSAYRSRVPDSTWKSLNMPGDEEYLWPNHEYQVWDGDTVTHVFSQQGNTTGSSLIVYFRRVGSDTLGAWDFPPIRVDTVDDLGQTVTASRVSGKVALVWIANLPSVPGSGESVTRGSQVENDIYYAMSYDMGATWGTTKGSFDKFNITKSDSSKAGWRAGCDLSCLIDTRDSLHVIWNSREWIPSGGGTFPHYYGARLLHWSENKPAEIRVIKDANWDPDRSPSGFWCTGGAWNEMSMVKMQISECDNKFYAVFAQFNDVANGIYEDCSQNAFTGGAISGGANGEIYMAVSDNSGYNWDIARNLTNSRTTHCGVGSNPAIECDADQWPSIPRFGMEVTDGDFTDAWIVDPTGNYSGNFYLDVFYVNDKQPGGAVQDAGIWTTNPLKWFRVPCIAPVPNPVLAITPSALEDPTWTKPGVQYDTTIRLEDIGNAPLNITTITAGKITGPTGWLDVANHGPITISHLSPNYYDLTVHLNVGGVITTQGGYTGYLDIESDNAFGTVRYNVYLIVADTVQPPEFSDIRTSCTRIKFNNAGNIGNAGNRPDGLYNLNYFNDCDTTFGGSNDRPGVYLYESSPFLLRINSTGTDTILNCYMFNATWLYADGFRPMEGAFVDSTTYPDYQYAFTGKFLSHDSSLAMEIEYFAPTDPDSCKFIVMKQRVMNNSTTQINNVYVGDLFDWDIPSDSAVDNGSGYDAPGGASSRDFMYCYGAEYGVDSVPNDDCVLANKRYGGFAFYNGYKAPFYNGADSLENPAGPWWTATNANWITPTGGWVPSQLYSKIVSSGTTWKIWSATNPADPDSQYVDLNMVSVFGKFNLKTRDTLVFVKILAMEYDQGLSGITSTIDKARAWIAARPDIFRWPTRLGLEGCCDNALNQAGDADYNGAVNILDVGKIIGYLYKGQPAPTCKDRADADGNNSINILDVGRIIGYLYKGGAKPVCGTTGT